MYSTVIVSKYCMYLLTTEYVLASVTRYFTVPVPTRVPTKLLLRVVSRGLWCKCTRYQVPTDSQGLEIRDVTDLKNCDKSKFVKNCSILQVYGGLVTLP